jgi:hypothetical protein
LFEGDGVGCEVRNDGCGIVFRIVGLDVTLSSALFWLGCNMEDGRRITIGRDGILLLLVLELGGGAIL